MVGFIERHREVSRRVTGFPCGNDFAFVDGHVQWLRFPGGQWIDGGPWVARHSPSSVSIRIIRKGKPYTLKADHARAPARHQGSDGLAGYLRAP